MATPGAQIRVLDESGNRKYVPYPGFVDEDFTSAGAATVTIAQTVTATSKVVVSLDGLRQQEGVAWTRSGQVVTFSETPPSGRWIQATIYLK